MIALVMNDAGLGDYYQGELRRGAERVCRERNIHLWVYGGRVDWTPSGTVQRQVFDLIDRNRIDGILLAAGCIASFMPLNEVLERLQERCKVPICAVGGRCEGVPSLQIDNYSGAVQLVNHLVDAHGCRQFAYIAGPSGHGEAEQRLNGTRDALRRHGLELRPEAIRHGNFAPFMGRELMQEWLEAGLTFDAVIAANDEMAVGALEALQASGRRCPEDVAVAGFDDSVSARFSQPALTSVRQRVAALAASGVCKLVEMWGDGPPEELADLSTDLVVRESCGCHSAAQLRSLGGGRTTLPTAQAELVNLLTPVLDSRDQREKWATQLEAAVADELAGKADALPKTIAALLSDLTLPHVHVEELQRTLSMLRARARESGLGAVPEDAFHAARVLVSAHASRTAGDRNLRGSWLLRELRRSAEQLATALSLSVLRDALAFQLPKLGIMNALVSLYAPGTLKYLEPLVFLKDGVAEELPEQQYPTELLMPDSALHLATLPSLTILPLTFQMEQLGVLALEIPTRIELYAILREQIGSAIKTVLLHQEVLKKQQLHAQAQEEKRATTERIESLSLIAGGVAHDLNNVLGPLVALPQVIHSELERAPHGCISRDVLEDLDSIQEAGQRAAYTIRDLLALGRLNAIPKTILDLNEIISAERRAFSDLCRNAPQVELELELAPEPLAIRASKPHLLRAVSNLVINAIDAMAGRGSLTIRVFKRQLAERLASTEAIEPGDYAVVEVTDTGTGIPKDRISSIFEPFFTVRRDGGAKGTGLGLAIVHRIVKDCTGFIHLESEPGSGTTFALYFPLQQEAATSESTRMTAPDRGSERILVVDDETLQLRVARRILAKLGYTVVTSQSGDHALELYEQTSQEEQFDLVIVDMMMPGKLNGIATIEQMKKLRPTQKALVATGFSPERMDTLAGARGLAWLPKPYTLNALSEAVRAVLDRTG